MIILLTLPSHSHHNYVMADDPIVVDTVDSSAIPPVGSYGRWAALVSDLIALPPGKCKRITPKLTSAEYQSLRSAALWRGRGLHVRTRDGSTWVWVGEPRRGFEGRNPKLREMFGHSVDPVDPVVDPPAE